MFMELLLYFERAGALPWVTMTRWVEWKYLGVSGLTLIDDAKLTGLGAWQWRPRNKMWASSRH